MLSSDTLNQLRQQIDHLDLEMLKILAHRNSLSDQVGKHKIDIQAPTRDLEREKYLIQKKLDMGIKLGLNDHFIEQLFSIIIDQSVRKQYLMKSHVQGNGKPLRVAYLGGQGSYSHQALLKYYSLRSEQASPFGYRSFKEIVKSVQNNEMDLGFLPIENTTSGAILEVYDLLQGSGITIVGEEILEIKHCLVGKNSDPEKIKTVLGHPQAITQCNELFLDHPDWTIEYCTSSAHAIEEVIKRDSQHVVAIANQFAADIYHLGIVMSETANYRKNYTRFILIGKKQFHYPLEMPCKISIVFSTGQQAGALATILGIMKEYQVVLTKLQSRPIPEMPWEEHFYADFEGHLDCPNIQRMLKEAENHCHFLKVLGYYPNSQLEKAKLERDK